MSKRSILVFLFVINYCTLLAQIRWTEAAPGVWKGITGTPETYNLLTAAGAEPAADALSKMVKADFPLSKNDIVAAMHNGKTYLRFPLEADERLFGFGLNFQTVHQRGKILQLHMDHYGGKDNGRTHAPVPFYVSAKGYGVFINSARYIQVYAGTGVRKDSKHPPLEKDRNTDKSWSARPYSDAVEIIVPAAGTELYLFAGPTTLDAVRRFNLFNGGGVLPPRWGLGFTQRVRTLFTADSVKKEADAFREKGYPLDFIGLEPGWQSRAYPCSFEWDSTRFPNPAQFVQDMLAKNIRLNLWINPYVSQKSSIYKSIQPYTGSHTVWTGEVPDFNMPEARAIFFGQLQKNQVNIGVSGYKIDEVDGYDHYLWPDVATFPSGISAEQTRQTYGVLAMRYSAALYRAQNQRTYGLVRASNAGAVSFPYVIYNDYYNHEDFITALINSGYAGVLWTPEARASKSAEEWLRRFQTVIFSPMAMINAWASGTKPWSYPEVAEQIKQLALLRMQMMPYWYSEFAKYHFEGTPVFRGMNLEEGFTQELKKESGSNNLEENPYTEAVGKEIKDQYMAGEYLLVAPLFAGQTTRKVVLPKGKWYDFYTGEYAGDGEVLTVTPGLDKIPVYVKDGGIIPMMPPLLHAPKATEKVDLEIRYYGTKPGRYLLYDDDGETFDYEKGDYSWREIKVENGKGAISPPIKGKPNTIGKLTWKFMTHSQAAIEPAPKDWWVSSMKTHAKRIAWWREAKLGMFIHWGIYSLPGGAWKEKKIDGYSEHLMRKERISRKEYLQLANQFNPVKFNAAEWIEHAKNAGMKYFIITAKHHDGFALFDSKVSDFTVARQTPFKRDLLAELASAAKKQGIKFGFYYSHAFDWEHPDAPGNDWEYRNPGGDLNLYGGRNWYDVHPELLPKAARYVSEKAIPQIKELLTRYHPDIIWFDTPHKLPLSENIRILQAIRETDANVVVNGRLARDGSTNFGDYLNTADRPAEFYPVTGDWEAIPTTNESYGYHQYDSSHKRVSHFIRLIASAAAKGGNLLMNIGPKGDGAFDVKDLTILQGIGQWMRTNGESIYGTHAAPLARHSWGVATQKGNRLYLHVFNWPANGKLYIGELHARVNKAWLLANPAVNIQAHYASQGDVLLSVPTAPPDSANTVIVLECKGTLRSNHKQVITGTDPHRLVAFDAQQAGKGFHYGDGKADRYYVEGWTTAQQQLSWTIRTSAPTRYQVQAKYMAPAETSGGSFSLLVNAQSRFQQQIITGPGVTTRVIGNLYLPAGNHNLQIRPDTIAKNELMKLLELRLEPAIVVASISELQQAINSAVPAALILMKRGMYSTTEDILIKCTGTVEKPITIAAEEPGAVVITGKGGFNVASPARHVIIRGFTFTHTASKTKSGSGTSFCRWTQNTFETPGTGEYLTIAGSDHEIDHNTFQNKDSLGRFIAVRGAGSQIAERLHIHHNYFKTQKNQHGRNGAEALQFGLSGFSLSSSNSIVEYNLFEDCDGENELISIKASKVIIRNNTIRNCPAQFTLRHGNFCEVYNNYFTNTPGLRIFGDDHQVHHNYFEKCSIGINIGNGGAEVADGAPLTSHDRPDRVSISSNILVNNRANIIQAAREKGLGSTYITIANNIIQGGGPAASIVGPFVNPRWEGNIIFETQGPGNMPAGSFVAKKPTLLPKPAILQPADVGASAKIIE